MAKKDLYKEYAHALYEVTAGLEGANLSQAVKSFVILLSKRQKLKLAPRILEEFERYSKKRNGVITLHITTAHELDKKTLDTIKIAFGKTVEATTQIEPSLLGGVKVKSEDTVFDASFKTQLQSLKKSLLA